MARNYLGAATVFQNVLKEDPNNFNALKKLIIALTQIGKHKKALEYFMQLIRKDINYIINTDPVQDDCPCPELVNNLELVTKRGENSFTGYQTLGILWLYCDLNQSIEYFEKALELKPNDENVNSILIILKKKLKELSGKNSKHSLF